MMTPRATLHAVRWRRFWGICESVASEDQEDSSNFGAVSSRFAFRIVENPAKPGGRNRIACRVVAARGQEQPTSAPMRLGAAVFAAAPRRLVAPARLERARPLRNNGF